jgi:hypothetical protein
MISGLGNRYGIQEHAIKFRAGYRATNLITGTIEMQSGGRPRNGSPGLYLPGLVGYKPFAGHPPLCRGCHRGDYARGGARASGDALSKIIVRGFLRIMPNPKREIGMKPNLLEDWNFASRFGCQKWETQ